jgi:hypothetical protein
MSSWRSGGGADDEDLRIVAVLEQHPAHPVLPQLAKVPGFIRAGLA